ncbi:MAG: polymerase, sigma-24 subunit, subfamily [Candidatus Krumholzibacteriota bacterium]|nr:polymerase, sigma-24 subunit, subfamily [Candidatus Krumholzibacteriota bacterium]
MTSKEQPLGTSDRELVSRAQRGEVDAFEELVHRYDRKVLSIAYSFTRDSDDAKDIYQEVFVRVYRALPRFESASEFSTWLHRIVMNVCLNHKKRAAASAHAPLEEVSEGDRKDWSASLSPAARAASPDRMVEDGEIRRHVELAMEALSPQEKLVFTLKQFEGFKLREIAAMMECTEGTVKRYLFEAMGKMRRKLKRVYR